MKFLHIGDMPEGGVFPKAILSMGDIVNWHDSRPIGWYVVIRIPSPFYALIERPESDTVEAGLAETVIAFCHDNLEDLCEKPPALPNLRVHTWTDLWRVHKRLMRVDTAEGYKWRWIPTGA